jgi:ABC-type multidrug transport system ATPase subunit
MCLVLGRPGSGCSSFLMSITNNRETFLETTGDVRYAGIEAEVRTLALSSCASCRLILTRADCLADPRR